MVPDAQVKELAEDRIRRFWDELEPKLAPQGAYLNFTEGEERREQARGAFDVDTWARLARLKAETDPDGIFAHGLELRA